MGSYILGVQLQNFQPVGSLSLGSYMRIFTVRVSLKKRKQDIRGFLFAMGESSLLGTSLMTGPVEKNKVTLTYQLIKK